MSDKKSYQQSGHALQRQADSSPSRVIADRKAFFEARIPQLTRWIRGGVKAESLVRFALLDLQSNQKLREADPQSVYLALLACAVAGLEPGSLRGEAYLVPFAGKAQFMIGYRGIIKLARRSREVVGLVANVVRENDTFEVDLGTANSVIHRPYLDSDRGDIVGAYAIATMQGGHREIEYLDRDSLERIRAVADKRGKSPAWAEWPDEMARKSCIRRIAKRLPMGDDFLTAKAIEDAIEDKGTANDVLDLETDGAASKVMDAPAVNVELTDADKRAIELAEAEGR